MRKLLVSFLEEDRKEHRRNTQLRTTHQDSKKLKLYADFLASCDTRPGNERDLFSSSPASHGTICPEEEEEGGLWSGPDDTHPL